MDWNSVTVGELAEALREVDWKAPRPVREFLQPNTFLPPKSFSKWEARVKNNLYYYRSNYAVLLVLSFTCCFLRNPWALVALSITGFGILCLNDPTATALNDQLLKIIKRVHPRTALRLRARMPGNDGNLGSRRVRPKVYILGVSRGLAVVLLCALGLLLTWRSAAILTLAWAILLGVGLPFLHATLRSQNLKARIATAREEFRAVWRGYQAGLQPDYTQ